MIATLSEKPKSSELAGKYLTFCLGAETYGIPVLKVLEIIQQPIRTAMPLMPTYIKGVINLRGKIISVVGLRLKFGLDADDSSERACTVVVLVARADGSRHSMGILVDGVEEVTHITEHEIEETPDFGAQIDTAYILGMAKIKGVVKSLIDIDKALTAEIAQLPANGSSWDQQRFCSVADRR